MKFIFNVKIKPGHTAEQYAAAWIKVSEILQRAPGARGTRLHRKIGDPSALLAIASWDSKDARDAMERFSHTAAKELFKEAAEHCTIEILGEFEEAEWTADPSEVNK